MSTLTDSLEVVRDQLFKEERKFFADLVHQAVKKIEELEQELEDKEQELWEVALGEEM